MGELARLYAGDLYFFPVQARRDRDNPDETLGEDALDEHRRKARENWEKVLAQTEGRPDRVLHRVQALFGLAAIAESGSSPEYDRAKSYYESIIAAASGPYPPLAAQAERRIETLDEVRQFADLPSAEDLSPREFIDPLLEDIFEEHNLDEPA